MRAFEELSSAGKARRLRAVALAALEKYGIAAGRLRLITNEFNAVFRVDAEDGARYTLRVNLPRRRTMDEVRAEMAWLHAIASETDIGVPSPIATPDGAFLVTASAPGVPEARHCVLFRWVDGVMLTRRLTERNLAALGELTARLHEQALGFPAPRGVRTWNDAFPLDDHPTHLVGINRTHRSTCARALEMIEGVLTRLAEEPTRMIHGDLHQDNVLVSGSGLVAIDFDDSLLGHPVQDIGATFWNLREEKSYDALRDGFRRGYERVAAWPETVRGDIEAFVADRSLMLIDHALHDSDPDEVATRPAFIRQEVRHLQRWIERHYV